ncbi:MAG: TIGR00341 family protein [Phycisphaerales bacterium]|nr:TIGR00341 family protein [Phycisphaerales bacterium]
MADRLLYVMIPKRHDVELQSILRQRPPNSCWYDRLGEDMLRATVLANAEETESICDELCDTFDAVEGFRVVIMPVEAAIPRTPAPEPPEPTEESQKKSARRISRDELLEDVSGGTEFTQIFVWMVVFSAVVAAVGLLTDNVAVIIGAMVIAPLLGPNMGLALGTTLGDRALMSKALLTNAAGFSIAFIISIVIGLFIDIDLNEAVEIRARTVPHLRDIVLALASGAAGALAFATGVPATLVGVMVAVALLPPLMSFGMLLVDGQPVAATGALVLLSINVICVNLSATSVFLLKGIAPQQWWEADKARRATRRALVIWIALLAALAALIVFGIREPLTMPRIPGATP